jgi:hypothetical protein
LQSWFWAGGKFCCKNRAFAFVLSELAHPIDSVWLLSTHQVTVA